MRTLATMLGLVVALSACSPSREGDTANPAIEPTIPAAAVGGPAFTLLETATDDHRFAAGSAVLERGDDTTTVALDVAGLIGDRTYIAHVHVAGCADAGGPHFKFDSDGDDTPPNEIHLSFLTNTTGAAAAQVVVDGRAGQSARSIVVHPVDSMADKIMCAEFG